MISKPIEVKAIRQYLIWLKFDDKTEGEVDLSHLVGKPVFENWVNPEFFKGVFIDPGSFSIAWDENIELCSDSLYFKIKGITFDQWKKDQYLYATN